MMPGQLFTQDFLQHALRDTAQGAPPADVSPHTPVVRGPRSPEATA